MTPIPYADDTPAFHPCNARELMRGGTWLVSEKERPEDWRERCEPIIVPPTPPKPDWSLVDRPKLVKVRRPVTRISAPRQGGMPKGHNSLGITVEELLQRRTTENILDIAKQLGCNASSLHRLLARSGVYEDRLCECGKPTGRATRHCRECSEKRDKQNRKEARKLRKAGTPKRGSVGRPSKARVAEERKGEKRATE